MKRIVIYSVFIGANILIAQDAKYSFSEPIPWNLPFFGAVELAPRGDHFGTGMHRDFQGQAGDNDIVTSRLTKAGKKFIGFIVLPSLIMLGLGDPEPLPASASLGSGTQYRFNSTDESSLIT